MSQTVDVFIETLNDISKIRLGGRGWICFFSKEELVKLAICTDMVKILDRY